MYKLSLTDVAPTTWSDGNDALNYTVEDYMAKNNIVENGMSRYNPTPGRTPPPIIMQPRRRAVCSDTRFVSPEDACVAGMETIWLRWHCWQITNVERNNAIELFSGFQEVAERRSPMFLPTTSHFMTKMRSMCQ